MGLHIVENDWPCVTLSSWRTTIKNDKWIEIELKSFFLQSRLSLFPHLSSYQIRGKNRSILSIKIKTEKKKIYKTSLIGRHGVAFRLFSKILNNNNRSVYTSTIGTATAVHSHFELVKNTKIIERMRKQQWCDPCVLLGNKLLFFFKYNSYASIKCILLIHSLDEYRDERTHHSCVAFGIRT